MHAVRLLSPVRPLHCRTMSANNPFHDSSMEPVSLDVAQENGNQTGLASPSLGAGYDAEGAMKVAVEPGTQGRIEPMQIDHDIIQPSGTLILEIWFLLSALLHDDVHRFGFGQNSVSSLLHEVSTSRIIYLTLTPSSIVCNHPITAGVWCSHLGPSSISHHHRCGGGRSAGAASCFLLFGLGCWRSSAGDCWAISPVHSTPASNNA